MHPARILGFPALVALGLAALTGCGIKEQIILDAKTAAGLSIGSMTFSSDEKDLAYSVGDWSTAHSADSGTIQVVSVPPSGKPLEIDVQGCNVSNFYKLAFSHKKHRIALASRDSVQVLTKKGKKYVQAAVIEGEKGCDDPQGPNEMFSLAWAPDDEHIAFSTFDKKIGVVSAEGGDKQMVYDGDDKVTLLAWTPQGIVVKEGKKILSIDPESKQKLEKSELPDDADFVTATPKGALYVVTSKGQVLEGRASGWRAVYTVKSKLGGKGKKKAQGAHWFRIGVSPTGKLLAVAEGQGDRDESGNSMLTLIGLPSGGAADKGKKKKGDDEGDAAAAGDEDKPKKKKKKAPAEGDDEAQAGGDDEKPKKKKKSAEDEQGAE